MASEKRKEAGLTSGTNVRIKLEPGTSAVSAAMIRNIKMEPGLPASTTRLTSFRVPRDLTLGANIKTEKPKKVYTPNLNVQRNKKKEEETPVKSNAVRGQGRGRPDRGRGRNKGQNNLVQSTGVFSEGIMETSRDRRSRQGGGTRSSDDRKEAQTMLEKPKLNLDHNIDKADEEEKLKMILRDDFIDNDADLEVDNAPVMLPMFTEGKLYKDIIKAEPETDDESEGKSKPSILEKKRVKEEKHKIHPFQNADEKKVVDSIPQVISNKSSNYILIQFPDCLPGLRADSDSNDVRSKTATSSNGEAESENKPKGDYCTLNSLKAGVLGKLQILRSGKARLVLGDNNLLVDLGSRVSFRQDVIATKVDTETASGEMINLGPISNTFICSPDWETMLANL